MEQQSPGLASPLQLRAVTLKNRIVISPMCMYSAIDGVAGDFHLAHLGRFALGGAGLVFVEATAINSTGRITPGCLGLWNDAQERALNRMVSFLHSARSAAGIQLNHSGRKGSSERPWEGGGPLRGSSTADAIHAWTTVGATEEPFAPNWPPVRALSVSELRGIVQDFAAAAHRADRAQFDVLEIHCAHGYLIHQFLSPLCNTRSDEYGGSLEGRMRLSLEVADAVRKTWPASKPLFARLSSVDGIGVGWSLEDSIALAREFKARGVDVIDCSSGGMRLPKDKQLAARSPGFQVPFAQAIRKEAGIPTLAVGLIREAGHARSILQQGQADLIAVAREALFDPQWPARSLQAEEGPGTWTGWIRQQGWWLERRPAQKASQD